MKSDAVYAAQIRDAIERIASYLDGVDPASFLNDPMRQDAVTRQLEVVGETVSRLSDAYRAARPEVPWRAIVGLRNRLAHDYIGIDMTIVWEVAQVDLPRLREAIGGSGPAPHPVSPDAHRPKS